MSERKALLSKRSEIDIVDAFDGKTLEDMHDYFEAIADTELAGDSFRKFSAQRYGYDGGITLYLDTYRWETDKEYTERLVQEALAESAQAERSALRKARADERARKQLMASEADERAEYERLRAKFEEAQ